MFFSKTGFIGVSSVFCFVFGLNVYWIVLWSSVLLIIFGWDTRWGCIPGTPYSIMTHSFMLVYALECVHSTITACKAFLHYCMKLEVESSLRKSLPLCHYIFEKVKVAYKLLSFPNYLQNPLRILELLWWHRPLCTYFGIKMLNILYLFKDDFKIHRFMELFKSAFDWRD